VFGLLFASDCLQVIFRRQAKFGDALKRWHSATPNNAGPQDLPVTAGREGGDATAAYRSRHRAAVQICSISQGFLSTPWSIIGSDKIRPEALDSCFDAFSSREPVSTHGSSPRACFARKRSKIPAARRSPRAGAMAGNS
jgi:hypothetical protein